MSNQYSQIYTDLKNSSNFNAVNINVGNTLTANKIICSNIVGGYIGPTGPTGPIGGLLSYSIDTDTNTFFQGGGTLIVDRNEINNPGGSILASDFTDGAIFEAYYSGKFKILGADAGVNPTQLVFGLTFDPVSTAPNKSFGVTQVSNGIMTSQDQSFEYRCTFRVASYTDSTIVLTFNTSAQIVTSNGIFPSTFGVNQFSGNNVTIVTQDRTINGNITLAFFVANLTDSVGINFSRYISYIKKLI